MVEGERARSGGEGSNVCGRGVEWSVESASGVEWRRWVEWTVSVEWSGVCEKRVVVWSGKRTCGGGVCAHTVELREAVCVWGGVKR